MPSDSQLSEEEVREMGKKEFRKEFPSGWMEITRYETLVLVLDAFLESPAGREYNTEELASKAGCSEKSIEKRISILVDLGIIEELQKDRSETRYTLDTNNPITEKLYELNDTVYQVKQGDPPESTDGTPDDENMNVTISRRGSRFRESIQQIQGSKDHAGSGVHPVAN
ncbi:hypothetical protein B4589_015570 (plasmid) [Halolamina sp. CBA1230]|uniref:hypothetical protein n=1 Tax=Halolamina sp. CBA1230 TaxID=1853690 RepID=UPI0009A1DBDE|nr:hypothetical protein [Halolamina sp. CBA1230]QKY21838.1 hypothetical protein B4589_015570 [Halolamina sp. CBA1230]